MGIGRGLIKVDDQLRFGRLVDELIAAGASMIAYSPGKDRIVVSARKAAADAVERVKGVEVERKVAPKRGGLAFLVLKWR